MNFREESKYIKDQVINIRRELHKIPEVDFQVHKTNAWITSLLEEWGIEYERYAGTGICAYINRHLESEKCIAVRGDMDALPIEEETGREFHSTHKGAMHACGHDGHMAIVLGTLKIVDKYKDKIGGCVKFVFEPAEETTGGATLMIEEGVLQNVQCMIGLHVDEECDTGKVRVNYGAAMASSNPFSIRITGKGGHGARPHGTIDPIMIAANTITAIQNIVSRETPSTEPCVISFGRINGGTTGNVIPEIVELEGTIRTTSNEHREYVKRRLRQVVEGTAAMMRGEAQLEILESYPCLINDDRMVELLIKSASDIIGQDNVLMKKHPNMGVESFAYFAGAVPSVFYFLGSRNEDKGIIYPAHNCRFDIDEDCLEIGVAIQCKTVFEFLNNTEEKYEFRNR